MEGLKQVGQQHLPIIGLAKARGEKEERIFLPGRKNPDRASAQLPCHPSSPTHSRRSPSLCDHLSSQTARQSLVASQLDQVIGIGEIRRSRLLEQFGSLANIAGATDDELTTAGLNPKTIAEMRKALAKTTPSRS